MACEWWETQPSFASNGKINHTTEGKNRFSHWTGVYFLKSLIRKGFWAKAECTRRFIGSANKKTNTDLACFFINQWDLNYKDLSTSRTWNYTGSDNIVWNKVCLCVWMCVPFQIKTRQMFRQLWQIQPRVTGKKKAIFVPHLFHILILQMTTHILGASRYCRTQSNRFSGQLARGLQWGLNHHWDTSRFWLR